MARFAFDSSGAPDGDRPSISLHPAFPAIVAAWFAALLGAGSLVLPGALLERGIEATGMAALIPSAAPPFGMTARGLIALAAALAGALVGVAVARRVSRAHRHYDPDHEAYSPSGARRPLRVLEDLGDGLFEGVGSPGDEQRAVAIAEDGQTSDGRFMTPLADSVGDSTPAFEMREPVGADPEPLPFTAPLLAPRAPIRPKPGRREPAASPLPRPPSTASDRSGTAGDEPGLAELVERLRAAIERRREARGGTDPATSAAKVAAEGFDPVRVGEAAQAIATNFEGPVGVAAVASSEAPADQAEPNWTAMSRRRRDKTDVVPLRGARVPHSADPSIVLADTDAALRAALASLRRMSGAA